MKYLMVGYYIVVFRPCQLGKSPIFSIKAMKILCTPLVV